MATKSTKPTSKPAARKPATKGTTKRAAATPTSPTVAVKSTPTKRAAKAAVKRGEVVRFNTSENPETFPCSSCGEQRPTSSFPTVASGNPEVRKSECRRCLRARIDSGS
jgi:hypothetical protein